MMAKHVIKLNQYNLHCILHSSLNPTVLFPEPCTVLQGVLGPAPAAVVRT